MVRRTGMGRFPAVESDGRESGDGRFWSSNCCCLCTVAGRSFNFERVFRVRGGLGWGYMGHFRSIFHRLAVSKLSVLTFASRLVNCCSVSDRVPRTLLRLWKWSCECVMSEHSASRQFSALLDIDNPIFVRDY